MRQDQYQKLQDLEERLIDVFIAEASPEGWPGRGIPLGQMDAKTRGDLYWVRKTAASAAILAQRVSSMIGVTQRGGGASPPAEDPERDPNAAAHAERQLDDEIARAEREAEKLMRDLQTGAGKAAFDRKVHGGTKH